MEGLSPPVWRRVLVPANILLPDLHLVIQKAMGWYNCHLHSFEANGILYGEPHPDLDYMRNKSRIPLSKIAPYIKSKISYEYDFGDSWIHSILVEKILPIEEGITYPVCIKGRCACPPEDCGGVWGYMEMQEALSDPNHEEHESYKDWYDGDLDPKKFDLDEVNQRL